MIEHDIRLAEATEENRVHVHMTNPVDGIENKITIIIRDEGIYVETWGSATTDLVSCVHHTWEELTDEEEKEQNNA